MPNVTEVAPDVYRISTFVSEIKLEFNHFLVNDEAPLLFHAGLRHLFPELLESVARIIDPARMRYIAFSHFESDECGGLNRWLEAAPGAAPACGLVGALVSINDFAIRQARVLLPDEKLSTGKYTFRYIPTPHVPHGWDAGLLLEETHRTLFCSDLFHQWGDREALTRESIVDRSREALMQSEAGPFANYLPYTHHTGRVLETLAGLEPRTLAVMHGSSFSGDGARALRELAVVMRDVLGPR